MDPEAYLVSRSCTTGWADWVHGDLWLTPEALIRIRLGWRATVANGSGPTLIAPWPEDAGAAMFTRDRVLAGHRTNKYLRLGDIARASLREGVLNSRLSVETFSGERHKLLWLRADPGFGALLYLLPSLIGDRLHRD